MLRETVRKVKAGERCWPAEFAVRSAGLALLALCASAISWLCRSLNQPPPHAAAAADYAAAMLAVLCWWFGWAFAGEGPGLFKLVPVPNRTWIL